VCSGSPYPGGGDLPERYRRTLDPYVALSVVAAQTDLEIGTCISLVAQHDPIALAKTIATLDFVSGGRFSLGVGYGWNVPELANHGREAPKRRAIVREYVALMRALWQDTEAEFHGDHADLSPSWARPKPVRQPSVPVLRSQWAQAGRPAAGPLIRPMLGIVGVDTLRRSFERFQSLGADQVVLDLQAVDDDILAVLDRYAAALAAL
jgi:alkanesulfonate monooxygenase SsuD/methylene tetrahydromethanopterin reductase-like flavin-dependent oxidoreductase (luciferase family)